MKKLAAIPFLALVAVIAGCSQPLPNAVDLSVGQPQNVTLGPLKSAFFRLTVDASPLRIDASPLQAVPSSSGSLAQADLDLVVYNADRVPIAVADSRRYFHAPFKERIRPLGIAFTPFWSVNLPPGTGAVYIEVKNWNPTVTFQFQVEATVRPSFDRTCRATDYSDATPVSGNTTGAILFLGQQDCYTYTGAGANLTLAYNGPLDLRLKVIHNGTEALLSANETYQGLQNGDLIFVYDYTNRQLGAAAGFCQNLPGCNDGLDTGEYTLSFN